MQLNENIFDIAINFFILNGMVNVLLQILILLVIIPKLSRFRNIFAGTFLCVVFQKFFLNSMYRSIRPLMSDKYFDCAPQYLSKYFVKTNSVWATAT